MSALDDAVAPEIVSISTAKIGHGLITAAVRVAADASTRRPTEFYDRTLVARRLIEDLRRELDLLGLGDDWRTLNKITRIEERQQTT